MKAKLAFYTVWNILRLNAIKIFKCGKFKSGLVQLLSPDTEIELSSGGSITLSGRVHSQKNVLLSAKDDGAFGYSLKLLVYNKSAHNLIVSASDVLANGKEVAASYFAVLNAGVYDIANIVFTPDELASNKISSVEEISFVMSASNAENCLATMP